MLDRVLNTPLDDTSRLDWSNKCVLLWKPSAFSFVIRNQSKIKTIVGTVTETIINNNSWYKTLKVSWRVFWVGDARNLHTSFFINDLCWNLKFSRVVLSGVIKCFFKKNEEIIIRNVWATWKIIKTFHMVRDPRKTLKRGENEKRKL